MKIELKNSPFSKFLHNQAVFKRDSFKTFDSMSLNLKSCWEKASALYICSVYSLDEIVTNI